MKQSHKNYLKAYFTVQLVCTILYFLIWGVRLFIQWEYISPFQWILDIPSYTPGDRLGTLALLGLIEFIKHVITMIIIDFN